MSTAEPLLAEVPYIIYDFLPGGVFPEDATFAPWSLDYRKGLSVRLHVGEPEMDLGDITEVIYYSDGTKDVPVVRETYEYTDGPDGLVHLRIMTIHWYDINGNLGEHPKVRQKIYESLLDKLKVQDRRRNNRVTKASEVCLSSRIMLGVDPMTAVLEGQAYWATLTADGAIPEYKDGNPTALIGHITNDTDPLWLDSVRSSILAEL